MKLIATPASPYSRKVRIVLAEKRIDYDFVIDSPGEAATRVPEFNPLGKIPVLVLDDDTTLGFLDLRQPDLNWRKPYPNLARLCEKLSQRASFKDTVPPKS